MSNFDFWGLAISWAPQFCCSKPERCRKELINWSGNTLVPHGLWPMQHDGTYPTYCGIYTSFGLKGRKKHEYEKHGSCSGIPATVYFSLEDNLMNRPEIKACLDSILLNSKLLPIMNLSPAPAAPIRSLDISKLREAVNRRIAVKASQYCQLEEITLCFEKTEGGLVGPLIDCPDSVMKRRDSHTCENMAIESATTDGVVKDRCAFISKALQKELRKT